MNLIIDYFCEECNNRMGIVGFMTEDLVKFCPFCGGTNIIIIQEAEEELD